MAANQAQRSGYMAAFAGGRAALKQCRFEE
ncbi:hypothetical protein ABID95_005774 [Streptomyces atratus]